MLEERRMENAATYVFISGCHTWAALEMSNPLQILGTAKWIIAKGSSS